MIRLSEVIKKAAEIQRIADIMGFKNICIFSGLEANEKDKLHLLVEIDQKNPNASFSNKELLAFILQEDLLACDVDVVIRSNIPSYLFPSIVSVPLLETRRESILGLFGEDLSFKKEPQELSGDELVIEQMDAANYRIVYEKMALNKIQADNLRLFKQQADSLGQYLLQFNPADRLQAECYFLTVIEKTGDSIDDVYKSRKQGGVSEFEDSVQRSQSMTVNQPKN